MPALSPATQSVLYSVITKSVGSGFRINDVRDANPTIRDRVIVRETTLLGLTTVFSTAIQLLFNKTISPLMQRNRKLKQYELLLRALVTAPALIFSEASSRILARRTVKEREAEQASEWRSSTNQLEKSYSAESDDDGPYINETSDAHQERYEDPYSRRDPSPSKLHFPSEPDDFPPRGVHRQPKPSTPRESYFPAYRTQPLPEGIHHQFAFQGMRSNLYSSQGFSSQGYQRPFMEHRMYIQG